MPRPLYCKPHNEALPCAKCIQIQLKQKAHEESIRKQQSKLRIPKWKQDDE